MSRYVSQQLSFTDKIYKIAAGIPRGKVATYEQLAQLVGSPKAARAVGMCMKHNPNQKIVPCHRVVASDGKLTGYSAAGGVSEKRKKLLKEGVLFSGERVDLMRSGWGRGKD